MIPCTSAAPFSMSTDVGSLYCVMFRHDYEGMIFSCVHYVRAFSVQDALRDVGETLRREGLSLPISVSAWPVKPGEDYD